MMYATLPCTIFHLSERTSRLTEVDNECIDVEESMVDIVQKRFEAHLEPILGTAYRMALNMAGNQDDAADIVQESALRAFRFFHTFREGTDFRAWFFRIVINLFLKWTRKRQREPLIADEAMQGECEQHPPPRLVLEVVLRPRRDCRESAQPSDYCPDCC